MKCIETQAMIVSSVKSREEERDSGIPTAELVHNVNITLREINTLFYRVFLKLFFYQI